MYALVMYDISTKSGSKRLNQVMKYCRDYGQRIQNSVFEIKLDYDKFLKFQEYLISLINPDEDSLKIYYLGKNRKFYQFGIKPSYDFESDCLII